MPDRAIKFLLQNIKHAAKSITPDQIIQKIETALVITHLNQIIKICTPTDPNTLKINVNSEILPDHTNVLKLYILQEETGYILKPKKIERTSHSEIMIT